eukprot:gene3998-14078_t
MTAAKELYRVDATMLAKVASNLFRTSPGVLAAAERLYCAELCKSGIVPGLLGISLGGTNGNPPPPPAPTPAVREGDTNAYKGAGTSKDADTSKDTDASKGAVASTGADASKGAGSALAAAQARAVAGRMDSSRSGIPNSIKALTAGVGVDADLALKAMDRLATVLDDCNGHDFMRIIRQGGVLAAAYELLTNQLLNMERLLRQQWCDMMLPTPNLAAQSAVSRAHSAAQSAFNSTGQGPGYDLMRTGGYPGTPSSRGGLAASSIRPRTPFMATNELPPSLMPAPLSGRQKKKAAGGEEASSAYREAEPHVNSSGAAVAMSAALGAEVVMERERAAAKNMDDLARSLVRGPPGPSRPSTSQQHEGLHNINNNHINQAGLQRSMNSCTPGHLLDPLGQTAPRSLPLFGTKLASLKPRAPTSELEEQTTASASSHLGGTMKDRASDSGVESQPSASAGSHLGGTIKHRASATGEEGQPSASASSHLGGTIKHRASATGAEGHPAGSSADGYCSTMKHRTSASGAEGHPAGSSADGYCSTMKHRTSASGAEGQPGGSFAEDVFGTMKSRRSLSGQGVLEGLGSIRKTMRSLNGQELLEGVASAVTSRRSLSGQGVPEGLGSTRKTRRSLNGQGLPEGTLTASTMTNRPSLTGQEEQLAASEPKRRSSTGGGEPLLGVGNGFGSTLKSRKFGTGPVMLPAEESAIDLEELLVLDGLGTLKDRDTDGPDGLKDRITDGPDGLKDRDTDGPDALKDRDTDGPDGMKDRDTDAGSCYSSDDDFQSPPHKPAAAGSRPNQTLTSDSKETPNSDRNQTPDSDPNQHSPDSHPNQQNTGSDLYQTPKYVPNDKPVHTPLSGHLAELTGIEQPVHTPLSEGLYGLTGILPPPGEVSLTRLAIAGSRPGTALTSKASYSMSDFPPMENLSAGALHSPAVSSATPDEKVVRPPIASAERPRTSSRPAIRPKSGLARSHLITTTSPTTTTTTTTSRPTTSQARSGAGRSPPPSRQISPRGSNSRPSSQESARGEKSRPSSSQSSGQKRSSTPGEGLRTSHGTPPPATAHKRSSTPGEGPSSSPGTPAPATSQKHSTSFGEVPFLEDGPLSTLNLAIPLVARHSQEGSTHEGSAAAPGIGAAHRSQGGSSHEGSAAAAGISAAHRSQEGSTRDGSATAATSPGNKTATDTNSACRPLSAAAAGTKAPVPRPKAPPARSRPSTALPVTRAKRGGAPSAKPYRHLRPPTGGRALTIAELISPAIKEGLSLLEIQAVDRPTQGLVTPRGVDMGDGGGEEVEGDDGVRVEGGDGGDEVEDDEGVRVEGGGDEVEGDEGDVRQTILEESFLGDLPKDELSGEKEVKEEKEEEEKEEEGFTSLMDELGSTYNGTPFDAAHVPDHTLGKMAKALGLSGPADVPTGTIGTLIIALGETGGPPANETLGALITDLKQSGLGSEADTERGDSDGDSTADEVEKAEEGEDDDQYSDYDVQEEEKLKEEEMERVVTLGRPVVIITQGSNGGGVISQGSIRMGEAFKGDQCVLDALQLGAVLTADEEAKYGTADPLVSSTSHATRAASASSTAHAAGAAVASSTSHAPVEELKEEEEDEEGVITLGRPLVIITQGSNGGGVISQGSTRMGEAFEGDQCVLDALQLGAVLTAGEEAKYGTADPLASSTSHATGTSDPLASSTSHATGTADPLASSTSHATGAVGSDSQSAAAPEGTGNMSQPNSQSGSSPGSPVPADSSPESHQSSPPPPRRTPPPDHHHPTQDCLHHQTPTTPPKTAFSPEPLSSPEDAAPTSLGADTVTTTSSLPTSAKQGHSRPGPASSSASKAPSLNSNPTRTPTESQQNPNNTPTSTPTRIPTEPQQNPNSTPTSTPTRTAGIRPHLAPSDTHSPKGSLPSPTSGRPPSAARFLSSTILTQSLRVQPQDKEYNVGLMDGAHQPNQGMQQSLRSRPISSGSVLNHSLSHRSLLNRPPSPAFADIAAATRPISSGSVLNHSLSHRSLLDRPASPAFADIAAGLPVAYLGSEINCPLPRGREKLVLPPISRVSAASATSAEDSPPAQRDSPLLYSFHERDCDRKSSHSREAAARGGDSAAGLRSSSAGSASGQGGGGPGGSTSSPPAVSRPHWSAGGLSSSMNMLRTAGPQGANARGLVDGLKAGGGLGVHNGAEARGLGDGLKAGGGGLGVHKVRRSSMMAGAGSKEPGSGRLLATAAPAVGQSTNFALDYSDDFEDDTLHDEWGANAEVQQARAGWKSLSLGDQIKRSQTSSDVMNEVSVDVQPDRVSVTLSWYGSVVEGPIPYEVNTEEVLWTVDTTGKQRKFDALHILMPKEVNTEEVLSTVDTTGKQRKFDALHILMPKEVNTEEVLSTVDATGKQRKFDALHILMPKEVNTEEVVSTVDATGKQRKFDALHIPMPKFEEQQWPRLFLASEEKAFAQHCTQEVNTEEVVRTVDATGKQRKFDTLHILMPKVEEQQCPCLLLASEELGSVPILQKSLCTALHSGVKIEEVVWTVNATVKQRKFDALHILMPKFEEQQWPCLFWASEELGSVPILQKSLCTALHSGVKIEEVVWTVNATVKQRKFDALHILMPKFEEQQWPCLFWASEE